jgi:hypothetical protein
MSQEELPKDQEHCLTDDEIINDIKIFGYIRITARQKIQREKRDIVISLILGNQANTS